MSCKSIEIQSEFDWVTHRTHSTKRPHVEANFHQCSYDYDSKVRMWNRFSLLRRCRVVANGIRLVMFKTFRFPIPRPLTIGFLGKNQYNSACFVSAQSSVASSLSLCVFMLIFGIDSKCTKSRNKQNFLLGIIFLVQKMLGFAEWEMHSAHSEQKKGDQIKNSDSILVLSFAILRLLASQWKLVM